MMGDLIRCSRRPEAMMFEVPNYLFFGCQYLRTHFGISVRSGYVLVRFSPCPCPCTEMDCKIRNLLCQ